MESTGAEGCTKIIIDINSSSFDSSSELGDINSPRDVGIFRILAFGVYACETNTITCSIYAVGLKIYDLRDWVTVHEVDGDGADAPCLLEILGDVVYTVDSDYTAESRVCVEESDGACRDGKLVREKGRVGLRE
jgi:hypothetical protein